MKKNVAILLVICCVFMALAGCAAPAAQSAVAAEQPAAAEPAAEATEPEAAPAEEKGAESASFDYQGKHKIGWFAPLTGDLMQYGTKLRAGAEMAIEKFNNDNGTDFTVEFFDDKGDPNEAVNIAEKIVSDPEMFVAFGSFSSSCAMAAAPTFVESDMLFYSPTASHTDFPNMGEMVYSIAMSQKYEGAEFASTAADMYGIDKKLAIIYQNTDNGVIASGVFKTRWEELGGSTVLYETFVPGQTKDFSSLISQVKESGAELLFVKASYNDSAQIFMQAKDLEVPAQFIIDGQCICEEFRDLVGTKLDGSIIYSSTPSFMASVLETANLDDATKTFISTYEEKNGATPDGFSAQGYDAAMLVLDCAMKAGSTDSHAISAEINKITSYSGFSGFDMHYVGKDMVKGIYIYEVENGGFKQVQP